MKKILFLSLIVLAVITAAAQSTSTRNGTGPNNDNTGRALTYKSIVSTDGSGSDTLKLNLNAFQTLVQASVNDTLNYNFSSLVNCYFGDRVTFVFTNATGSNHLVRFVGSNVQIGSGTNILALTSAKLATISFIFTGVTWLETARLVQ